MRPNMLFSAIWVFWIVSWGLAAFWSGRTEKSAAGRYWYFRGALVITAVLLFHSTQQSLGSRKLWHVGYAGGYALAGLALAGILFAWWARLHMGRLWSGGITLKAGHRVLDSGPYALVRHPIYTGLLTALFATAAAKATLPAIAGVLVMFAATWFKARAEENFLTEELGPEAYGAYRKRVPMLIPFWPV